MGDFSICFSEHLTGHPNNLPYYYRLRSLLRRIYAYYQILLCLLSNVFLFAIKCVFACYQTYFILLLYVRQIYLPSISFGVKMV